MVVRLAKDQDNVLNQATGKVHRVVRMCGGLNCPHRYTIHPVTLCGYHIIHHYQATARIIDCKTCIQVLEALNGF